MSWSDYEKAKSAASGSSGSRSIAEKRVESEIKKSNPNFSGFANVLQDRIHDVDLNYIDNYINDLNSYTFDVDLENLGWGTAQHAYKTYVEKIRDLRDRGGKILGYLDHNIGSLDRESYNLMRDQVVSAQNSLAEQMGALNELNHYYSQWDTEDAYNRAMQENGWLQKYQGKGYQELVPLLEGLEDGEEKTWLKDYAGYVDYDERVNMDLEGANREIQALQDQLNRARNLEENYKEYRSSPLLMLTQGDTWRDLESRYDAFTEQYGSIEQLQADIDRKRQRMAEGKQTQDSIRQVEEYEQWKQNVRDPKLVQQELDRVNQALALNQTAIREANRGSTQQDMTMRAEADAGRQALEQQRTALEQELQYGRMREYAALMQRPDFEKNSQYTPTGDGMAIRDNATGQMVNPGFGDIEYDYINKNPKAEAYQGSMDSVQGLAQMGLDRSWLLQLTEDEVKVYNYLYRTEGRETAREYLQVMRSELNRRQRTAEETKWAQYAQKHPWKASAASVVLAPMKAIGAMGMVMDQAADGRIDQNAGYNRASYVSKAIRDQVTQEIQKNEKWGQLGAFGYQTAMSMGDFLMNGVAGGGLFGVPGVTMAIMGSGAAADTVISAKDRGVGDAQAFGLGIVAGLAEALTERFSLEALLDADLLKNGIGVYVLKNSLTEGSEEVASSVINLAADIIASKEKSEWQQAIRSYQDMGYSEEEAFAKAMADQAASMGMDFIGGALSGGIMSGANSAGYYADTKRTGRALGRRGLTDTQQVQQILDAGTNAEKGSTANAVAAQLQKKVDAGQKLSQYEKGRLYQSNPEAVGEAVFGKGSVSLATPTTQGIDNKDERWQQAQRLASITGRDIKFYNGAENENGYYDKKTGEIYVNTNAADTVAQVVSHELTHSTELADSYSDLARFVRGKLRAEGKDWDQLKKMKVDLYAAQGHSLEIDADIEAEIVAEYVQNHLLTNEQEIFEAVWEIPTLGQKILNWIDGILAKLNNQKAKERQMLNNARQIYVRALEESQNNRTSQTAKSEPKQQTSRQIGQKKIVPPESEADIPRYMGELYAAGEITEQEYDEYLAYQEHDAEAVIGGEGQERQYSFAGQKAKTADLEKLHQAKALQAEGVDNETIRQQTGWFQGMDKKWRFEIDDSNMQYHRAGDARFAEMHADYARHNELTQRYIYGELSQQEIEELEELDEIWGREHNRLNQRVKSGNAQLQNIIRHDALFEAYPELRGVNVRFEDLGANDMGTFYPTRNLIILNSNLRNAPQRTILHEVQHSIQRSEGFAKGSSPEYWDRKLTAGEEVKTRGAVDAWNKLQAFEYDPKNAEALKILRQMNEAEETLEYETLENLEEYAEQNDLTDKIRQYEDLRDAYYGEESKAYNMVPSELYHNTAGEIEARDTANRWKIGLDEEGRKKTPPDLGDEQTVFAGADSWMAELDEAYADRENYVDADIPSEEVESGIHEVATMAPVAQITGNEFAKGEVDLITQVERFFAEENNEAYNPQLGKVILDRKGVKSDIAHGIGRKKAAAFAAVPDVIEKGRVVDYQENWKGRGYDTAVIAAPILIAEEEHFAAVIAIRSRNTNLFYVHEVLTTKNGAMPFKTGARKSGLPSGDAPSIFSILNRLVEVKNNGEVSSGEKQFSITSASTLNKRDVARDLQAILSRGGDPRELQRYVDGLKQTGRKAEQKSTGRYQTGENRNSTAKEILETAHGQGKSVEEYLRWNPEQFEMDGKWRPEALDAMRMEQGGRKYSLNQEDAIIPEETEESQAHVIQRENLPTKAQRYLVRAESTLLNRIGEALSVPRHARYNSLKEIIQEISNTYLADGTISDEKMSELFDKAYAAGIVTDAEFYNQYKEIKDHLRTYGVTISDRDKSNIPDFDDFRKRAFGTLRILNEGGVPVDTAYDELRNMAPELFPDSITHPADQLVRMFEVGQSIAVSQKNLDEYYGHSEAERDEFRKWAKNDFDAAVGDAFRDLRQVRRYAEEQSTQEDVKKILTVEEAEEAFQELKKLRRNVDKVRAKNLLTESDEILLGRMMKGEIGPQHLNPNEDNVKGITALYEAKMAYESQVEVLAAYKRSVKAKRLQDADRYLETATGWKDKKAGVLYARETMRRNIMDIVPDKKLAEQIAEHYFEAVHMAEAQSTKFKNDYRDRVRALNLSTKVIKGNLVSEAHAVQLLGEAMDNIRVMENARGRMGMRDGKTLAEWRAVVDDLWMNNTGLDRQKVERAVEEFRKIYDELFQQMNRIRVENGYEPVNYRQGYFPHFQPGGDGIMGFFGKVMGINTQVDALPTTINGLTHTFKPGIQWFGNAQERIGFNTAYDAVEGFDRYIEGVSSVIFQTENIQKLRALATQARYRTSDEGIRKQVDAVRMDDRLTEEEKQREINAIYEHGRFALSNFVAELDEYTNLLANKKSKYDRTMESLIGRRAYTMMKAWENRVGANMIAGNISSALTNFIPLTQAGAQLDSGMMLKGMLDTLRNMKHGDNLVGMSDFLTNRRGSDVLVKTWMQKASGVMGTPMELIDNFTSETIVRAAYLQNLKRGMSETEAMHQADIFASGVMADRSKGAMPTLFESRNPLFKAFTQFQLEVNNQFSEIFKDLPRNHKEKGLAMLAIILLKYFLGAWMYNELFEKVIGRRSALDPIGILLETGEDLTGYEIPNLFDMIGGEQIEKTGEGSIGEAGANLATNILGELPFSAGLNLFGFESDGGRLPAASAVPDLSAIWDAATEKELTGDQRWKMLQDELNKLAYVLPPFGGGQISKSWKGIKAYLEGGSYSLDKDGDEILQYAVYKDDPDDAFWSLVRAAFLGKNSLPEAQDWVKSGYNSLDQYETVVYKDLLECGVKDRDAYALVDQLRKLDETETEAGPRRAEGRRILAKSDISAKGKAAAFYGMVATKTEREWMDKLVDTGADQADTMVFVSNLYDADKLRGAEKKQEQYMVFMDSLLTEEEKKVAVGFIMDTDMETESGNPTQFAKFLTAIETGLSVDKYMEIRAKETDIDDYLELTDVGIKGDKSADLAISMATLEPGEGYDKVTWLQRCRTVMDADLTEAQKLQALQTVDGLYESTYDKIMTGHNFGMNVKSYIDLKSIMPQFDENGNGTYTQAETEAAINALAGDDNVLYALTGTTPNGYTLTDKEKAILWQIQNKSWKPYRNPFDKEVGQMVYDYMTAEDPTEAVETAESGMAFDTANLFSKVK